MIRTLLAPERATERAEIDIVDGRSYASPTSDVYARLHDHLTTNAHHARLVTQFQMIMVDAALRARRDFCCDRPSLKLC